MSNKVEPPRGVRTQIGQFVITPAWVIEACGSDARALQLYNVLGEYANPAGRCWPPRGELRAKMGVSKSTLERAIQRLKQVGALRVVVKHRSSDGACIGADYVLVQVPPTRASLILTSEDQGREPDLHQDPPRSSPVKINRSKDQLDPLNQIQEQEKSPAPPAALSDVDRFVAGWNAMVADAGGQLLPALELTPQRRTWIAARLKERSLEAWLGIMRRVGASPFCRGEVKDWSASFLWLIRSPDAGVQVLEGQYDDRRPTRPVLAVSYPSFDCPHDPRCSGRAACQLLVELEAARAEGGR